MRLAKFHIWFVSAAWLLAMAVAPHPAIAEEPAGGAKAIAVEPIRAAEHLGERRYALVIGIDRYADPAIPPLTTCENDARAVHRLLTDPHTGGVDAKSAILLLGEQATFLNLRKALNDLSRIPADSTVFIYFSGHGAKESDEAYWVTQDAELNLLAATAMPDRELRAFLEKIPSQRVIVMIDACYAAATVKGGKALAADFSEVLQKFTGKGRAFLMAAGSGEEAIEAHDLRHSVFTHYLVEGLAGRADENADGVVVLPELTNYIDRHVADEARVRGGVQKPVVRMEEVQEPAKFRLTIDAERLRRNMLETAELRAKREARLGKLRALYLDEKLTLEQYQTGQRLVATAEVELDAFDRRRFTDFAAVADGVLEPEKLQRALDAIETPQQRAARMEHEAEARAEAQKQARIAELLATAKADDNEKNDKAAMAALDKLLEIAPDHAEAKAMRDEFLNRVQPRVTNVQGITLVWIPPDEFLMGSPVSEEGREPNERQRRVRISRGFYMGLTEITQSQWTAVMGTTVRDQQKRAPYNINYLPGLGDDLPMYLVSWHDAVEFCARLSEKSNMIYRLPTEAEWEYACRASTTSRYNFGHDDDDIVKYGWCSFNSRNSVQAVSALRPNRWGLADMHGNVQEWCSDWYLADYTEDDTQDPVGARIGTDRVIRGGAWHYVARTCRSAARHFASPDYLSTGVGFRVVAVFKKEHRHE